MSDPTQSPLTPDPQAQPDAEADRHDQPEPHLQAPSGTSRRHVLRAVGMVALVGGGAAALAACGAGGSSTPAASTAPSSSAPTSEAPSASGESSSAAPSASTKAPSASGPSVSTAEVPVGSGIIMPDAAYVVTQPEKGSYKAFSKICTHQGCAVTMITNKEIVCPCHGSHFSISDGSVVSGPAPKPLPEAKATVSGSTITVSA